MKRPSTIRRRLREGRSGKTAPAPTIRILLVEDHTLVRQCVRALLEGEEGMLVVGEAEDGRQAVALAARLRPDVILMDIAMPALNGIEASRQILESTPSARILVLSAHSDVEYVDAVLALGVAGYVLKQSSLDDLAAAIRAAHAGRQWFSAPVSRQVQGAAVPAPPTRSVPPARVALTSREAEILQLVAEGVANKQSALVLGISVKTVEKHRQSLMTKLDIHDVAGLTRYAIEVGSIEGRDRRATP